MLNHIMLAKDFESYKKELQFPVLCSEKLDGAAAECTNTNIISRQDTGYLSSQHIIDEMKDIPGTLFGELHVPGLPFKDSSGRIRGHKADTSIHYGIYDYMPPAGEDLPYVVRMCMLKNILDELNLTKIFIIDYVILNSVEEIYAYYNKIMALPRYTEGIVIRPSQHKFQPNKRTWDMLRLKAVKTVDLLITGYEEAISKQGVLKNMVGKLITKYNGIVLKPSPGTMKHSERISQWKTFKEGKFIPRIGEIKYKPDDSYTSLREARFYRWRDDKTKPNSIGE